MLGLALVFNVINFEIPQQGRAVLSSLAEALMTYENKNPITAMARLCTNSVGDTISICHDHLSNTYSRYRLQG
jgi:hypothetical protein